MTTGLCSKTVLGKKQDLPAMINSKQVSWKYQNIVVKCGCPVASSYMLPTDY